MAKAQPFLWSLLARARNLSLLSSEDFSQAFHNNPASHQKALGYFDLFGHALLSSHSDTSQCICFLILGALQGNKDLTLFQVSFTLVAKGCYSPLLYKLGGSGEES